MTPTHDGGRGATTTWPVDASMVPTSTSTPWAWSCTNGRGAADDASEHGSRPVVLVSTLSSSATHATAAYTRNAQRTRADAAAARHHGDTRSAHARYASTPSVYTE